MILEELRSNLDAIVKKEVNGNRISPSDLNRILESSNEAFFKGKLDFYLRGINGMLKDGELDTRFIESYLTLSSGNALAAGILDLTDIETTVFDIAAIVSVKGTYNASFRKIDYVTPQVAHMMHHNLMGRRLTSYPICYRVGENLYFLPTDVTSVDVIYAEWPTVPFLDYYIDANGLVVYLNPAVTASQDIESSTNATPIVVTITGHGLNTGDEVLIAGHETNTNANGTWFVTYVSADTFNLDDSIGNGVGGATGTCTEGVSHVWANNEIDSSGVTRAAGQPDYSSVGKELDYEPQYHYEFMMECLAQYAMSLNNANLIEYAEGKKKQVNER